MRFTQTTAALVPVVLELDIRAGAVVAVSIHARDEGEEHAALAILDRMDLPIASMPSRPVRAHGLKILQGGRDNQKGRPSPGRRG